MGHDGEREEAWSGEQLEKDREEEERFKDSRGSGPRTSQFFFEKYPCTSHTLAATGRKTEEGFSIFKEDELGINDEGGGESYDSLLAIRIQFRHRYPIVSFRLPVLYVSAFTVYSPRADNFFRFLSVSVPSTIVAYFYTLSTRVSPHIPNPALSKPRLPLRQW